MWRRGVLTALVLVCATVSHVAQAQRIDLNSGASNATLPAQQVETTSVTYPAGWNLIAGVGAPITGTDGPLYTWQPRDQMYEAVPADAVLAAGVGYWAHFEQRTEIAAPAGGTTGVVPLPAGQWVMVGRSPFAGPVVRGADVLFVYNTILRQYEQSTSFLSPGQGAWALSFAGGFLTFAFPGAPAP